MNSGSGRTPRPPFSIRARRLVWRYLLRCYSRVAFASPALEETQSFQACTGSMRGKEPWLECGGIHAP